MTSSTSISQDLRWYALRVKSNREKVTSMALTGKGYDVFLPTYGKHDLRRDRPLFPGYLFSRFDVRQRLPILTVPGIVHIVGTGNNPIPVDDDELESVRILINSDMALDPGAGFSLGEFVRVVSGPLSGAQGYITGIVNQRFMVTITLLQRTVSVELQPEWITIGSQMVPEPACSPGLSALGARGGL